MHVSDLAKDGTNEDEHVPKATVGPAQRARIGLERSTTELGEVKKAPHGGAW